jgi:hypothetical protein
MNRLLNVLGVICLMTLATTAALSQSLTITSPNGAEVWQGCTVQTITWVDSGTSNFYSIDYSVDNGASWTSIATFYNTTLGQYSWTLPNIQSTQALVRVQDSNNTLISDVANATFSMVAPLLLTSPNGGQQWTGGSVHAITWIATGTSNYYSLDYSLDGGNNWISINSYFYNTSGSYNWTVPNTPSSSALVRVSDYNAPCKTDKSNAVFEIPAATPTITVTAPNTSSTLYVGQNYTLSWTSQYVTSNQVQLDYSIDGGATWIIINPLTVNDGSETWSVPATISTQC